MEGAAVNYTVACGKVVSASSNAAACSSSAGVAESARGRFERDTITCSADVSASEKGDQRLWAVELWAVMAHGRVARYAVTYSVAGCACETGGHGCGACKKGGLWCWAVSLNSII